MAGGSDAQPVGDAARRPPPSLGWFPRRPLGYWLTAAVILAATTWAAPFIDAHLNLKAEHDWLFQRLTHSEGNRTEAGKARLVIIEDNDYWLGPLHHRVPTDRRYLAAVVRALNTAGADVIALDFDLSTPTPAKPVRPGDFGAIDSSEVYRAETDELIRAIVDVAKERKIVLAKTISGPDNGPFHLQSDAYQAYGLCIRLTGDGVWANPGTGTAEFKLDQAQQSNISCGYIALMDDAREIPPPARIVGQPERLDAFPLAIVRAHRPYELPNLTAHPYYARYIEGDVVNNPHITMLAKKLLADPMLAHDVLHGLPVVVGAGWHRYGFASGPIVDLHPTPIGEVSGALIHMNLAEAILSGRSYPGLSGSGLMAMEVLTGVAAAVLFAGFSRFRTKLAALVGAIGALFAIQWLVLGLFGVFFDAFAPVVALGLHTLTDRLVGETDAGHPSPVDRFVERLRRVRLASREGEVSQ